MILITTIVFVIILVALIYNSLYNNNHILGFIISMTLSILIVLSIPINDYKLTVDIQHNEIHLDAINYFLSDRSIFNFENRYYYKNVLFDDTFKQITKQEYEQIKFTYKKTTNAKFKIKFNTGLMNITSN